jgi:hypothetical protein
MPLRGIVPEQFDIDGVDQSRHQRSEEWGCPVNRLDVGLAESHEFADVRDAVLDIAFETRFIDTVHGERSWK